MTDKMKFVLPWPPSVNGYWRSIIRGNKPTQILSEPGRRFRNSAVLTIKLSKYAKVRLRGRVAVHILLNSPTRRKYDVDNYGKGVLDALTHAGIWDDDEQVDELTIERGSVVGKTAACAIVTIWEIEP